MVLWASSRRLHYGDAVWDLPSPLVYPHVDYVMHVVWCSNVGCDGSMPLCRPAFPSNSSLELGSSLPMSTGMLLAASGEPLVDFDPLVAVLTRGFSVMYGS